MIKPINLLEDLDYLLETKTSTVQNDGIQFKSAKYVDKDGKLTPYVGRTVRIFFNRNDVSTIRVYCRDAEKERFLCIAHRNLTAQQIAEQNKKIRSDLRNDIRASRQRLKNLEPHDTLPASVPTKQPATQCPPVSSSPPSAIRRYRFELEELEDDADTNVL